MDNGPRTLKEKKERAYVMGYAAGLNNLKADQPYMTLALAKEWKRGFCEGKDTRVYRIAEFNRLRSLTGKAAR